MKSSIVENEMEFLLDSLMKFFKKFSYYIPLKSIYFELYIVKVHSIKECFRKTASETRFSIAKSFFSTKIESLIDIIKNKKKEYLQDANKPRLLSCFMSWISNNYINKIISRQECIQAGKKLDLKIFAKKIVNAYNFSI